MTTLPAQLALLDKLVQKRNGRNQLLGDRTRRRLLSPSFGNIRGGIYEACSSLA